MKLCKVAVAASFFVSSALSFTQEEIKSKVGEGCPNQISFTSSFLTDGGDLCESCSYCPGSLRGDLFDPKKSSTCVECGDSSNTCNKLQVIMSFHAAWKMSFFPLLSSNASPSDGPRSIMVKGSNSYDGDAGSNDNSWITLYDSEEQQDLDFSSRSVEHLFMLTINEEYKFYSVTFLRKEDSPKLQVGHIGVVQSYLRECCSIILEKLTGIVVPAYITPSGTPSGTPSETPSEMPSEGNIIISKGNLIDTINKPSNEFILSFQLHPKGAVQILTSVIRLTSTNNECCYYGDRWIALWFNPNSYKLHYVVGAKSDKNGNNTYGTPGDALVRNVIGIQPNQWNDVKIVGSGDYVKLHINGILSAELSNVNRPQLDSLDVYAGDAFWDPANAHIRNFKFENIAA